MPKVYIWECPIHGEMELTEDLEEAFCPKCGAKMTKKGDYEEKD